MQLCQEGNKCGPGCTCRCKNCSNAPSPTGTQQQSSDELVEIEEEEVLHDDSLKRECGEVCASSGGSDSPVCDAEDDV